jgi:hypothetical protein
MVEAESLRDQFKGWNASERDAKVNALADVIVKYEPWSLECSVSRADHNRIIGPISPYDIRDPYFTCFCGVILHLAQWHASMGLETPVDFIFEERVNRF